MDRAASAQKTNPDFQDLAAKDPDRAMARRPAPLVAHLARGRDPLGTDPGHLGTSPALLAKGHVHSESDQGLSAINRVLGYPVAVRLPQAALVERHAVPAATVSAKVPLDHGNPSGSHGATSLLFPVLVSRAEDRHL
jgi:hypothetical protein